MAVIITCVWFFMAFLILTFVKNIGIQNRNMDEAFENELNKKKQWENDNEN